jgi:hypothetical protein
MKKYTIIYKELGEKYQWTCRAYNKVHAAEKFNDPDTGFTVDMIEKIYLVK